jgi:sugar lactone lactonase YvrE
MRGICIDKQNRLYITEGTTDRVSVFQLEDRTVEVTPK